MPTTGSRGARRSQNGDELHFPVIDGLASLTYLVNLASLELHVHQWKVGKNGRPKNPDRLVIDLDPGDGAGLGECAQVALLVRDRLAQENLDCLPVTSGSKGLHLYADLPGRKNADEVRDWVHAIAEELEKEHPKLMLSQMTKARRSGKVFLDWSQNTGAKTTISPYSLRGRDRADGRRSSHLGRDRGGRRRPAGARPPAVRGGARAGARSRATCSGPDPGSPVHRGIRRSRDTADTPIGAHWGRSQTSRDEARQAGVRLSAASRTSAPSASNRAPVTRSAGPQTLTTATGRRAESSTGADTPCADSSYSPRHTA